MSFLQRHFGGKTAPILPALSDPGRQTSVISPQEEKAPDHSVHFTFTDPGWEHLHLIGLAIQTSEPSQIIRRALGTLWLVASGQCELRDKISGKSVKIPD